MMTGDKEETAVSVAYNAGILPLNASLCYITENKKKMIIEQITEVRKT